MTGGQDMNAGPQSSTVAMVSGNDLLQRLDAQTERLTRIEVSVTDIPRQVQHLGDRADANAGRIAVLEQWRAFWVGITSVVTLLLTAGIIGAIITAIHH